MAKIRAALVLFLAALIGALVILNHQMVRAHLIVARVEMPLFLLLVVTAGSGFLLGVLATTIAHLGRKGR